MRDGDRCGDGADAVLVLCPVSLARPFWPRLAPLRQLLGKLYRPHSELVWNGNKILTLEGIGGFFSRMPPTRHEVQAVDCHPLAGTSPPRLMISVSGLLHVVPPSSLTSQPITPAAAAYYAADPGAPPIPDPVLVQPVPPHPATSTHTTAAGKKRTGLKKDMSSREKEELPRTFVQTFVLAATGEDTDEGRAAIQPEVCAVGDESGSG